MRGRDSNSLRFSQRLRFDIREARASCHWSAADNLHFKSDLKASEYGAPILDLIFRATGSEPRK